MSHKPQNGHGSGNHQPDKDRPETLDELDILVDVPHGGLVDTQRERPTTMPPLFVHNEKYHEAGKRDVELYIRTYNTLLRSSGEINLKALVQAHYNIDSSLHPDARSPHPDMSAFIYSVLRLPVSAVHCDLVLLGQEEENFVQQGFLVDEWQAVTASARRRKWFYESKIPLTGSHHLRVART